MIFFFFPHIYWLFLLPHTPVFFSFSTLLKTHNSTKHLQVFPSLESTTKTNAKCPSSDSTEPSDYLLFIAPPLPGTILLQMVPCQLLLLLPSPFCPLSLPSGFCSCQCVKTMPPHPEDLGASLCTLPLVSQVLTRLSVLLQGDSGDISVLLS